MQRALMNSASALTDVQRQPIEKLLQESESLKVDGLPPPPNYPARLAEYAQIEDVARRDERYAYFAQEHHQYPSKAARDTAATALERISDPDLKLAVRWALTAYAKDVSFDDVKEAWSQIPNKYRNPQTIYDLVHGLAPHLPAHQQDVLEFLHKANLQSAEKVMVIGQCVAKARKRMTDEQATEMLLVAVNELPKCDNPLASFHSILSELARVSPNETEKLIERYGEDAKYDSKGQRSANSKSWLRWQSYSRCPGKQRELLRLLRADDEIALRAFKPKYGTRLPFPLYRDIADPKKPIKEAQFYADSLVDIADSLDDKEVSNRCRMVLLGIGRPELRVKGSQEFLKSLNQDSVNCHQLLNALPRMDQDLQKEILRKAFPTNKPPAQARRRGQYSGLIASSLLARSTIPLTQKRNYAQKLLKQCKSPRQRFYVAQRFAKFDAYVALEIVWEVRDQLNGEMPHSYPEDCGGWGTGYGVNDPWPDDTLGWLEDVFDISWTSDAGDEYNGYSLPPRKTQFDETLIEGVDRFLKKETIVKNSDDRDALMLCRCCAEARLGDFGVAMVTAQRLKDAKHQVKAFAHILWLMTRPKLPQLHIVPGVYVG